MDKRITIVYHHGGNFITKSNGSLVYDNDHTDELTRLDEDVLDVFSLRDYYKVLGYDNMVKCWWLVPGRSMKSGLRALSHDKELVEMCFYAQNNRGTVHIYYEHGVSQPMVEKEAPELRELTPNATGVENVVEGTTPSPKNNTPTSPSHIKSSINITSEGPSNAASKSQPASASTPLLKEIPAPKPTPKPRPATKEKPQPTPKPKPATKETPKPIPKPGSKPKSTSKPAPKPNPTSNTIKSTPKSGPKPNPTPKSASKPNPTPKSAHKSKATSSKSIHTATRSSARLKGRVVGQKQNTGSKKTYVSLDDSNDSDSDSHDSYEFAEDTSLEHKTVLLNQILKGKEKIVEEDDGLVVENSDEEVDWVQVLDEEWSDDDDVDDVHPIFSEGGRFGELKLQVGMNFSNKNEFMDAVREFTIQEGREIKFRRNESYGVRAICKWKMGEDEDMVRCPWVAYASRDSDETCWQIKTFKNEHICPRMSKNRAANRRWLAGKLVKKLRRYPSLKHRPITQKRRKNADEESSSVKKSKTETKVKRKYKEFTCTYCGTRGHTKRSCAHRKADDLASALVNAAAAVVAKEKGSKAGEGTDPANAATTNTQAAEINENASLAPGQAIADANASEIVLTQPTYSQPKNQEQVPPSDPPPPPQQVTRPHKLQSKRKTTFNVDPMHGASSGTAARLAEFMTFVPPQASNHQQQNRNRFCMID
ncbi:hypothetical protein Ahy_B07g086815 [Arachis hypogaea]|uniref:CCHC-type domain-containing protein n=1 Tax=Arachis hypogaea TaxID=3818 RepID=A0A444YAM2_ARAHY|nr:hypothetical protein Ahy_B07g086815 [Arachis hypogaea]